MTEANNYKVIILAAGRGTRMGKYSEDLNKALLPIAGKTIISTIIEKFPEDVEVIIAVGSRKEQIIDFVEKEYKDSSRKVTCVNVENFDGPGSGPGLSLLYCKPFVPGPFILTTADTLVEEVIPPPTENWMGVAEVDNTERFCSARLGDGMQITHLDDKVKSNNKYAVIGLNGIKDFEAFWDSLEGKKDKLIAGELQLSNGFEGLIEKKLLAQPFTWFDTGTIDTYEATKKHFEGQ